MEYIVLGATGLVAYNMMQDSNKRASSNVASTTMNHYDARNENRSPSYMQQSSLLLDQLTLEDARNRNYALAAGNAHADIALQGLFIKDRVFYPPQSFAQKSNTMARQALQQTYPGEQRSLFNINFSRLPSALGENRPGFNDRISKARVRL